MFITSHQLLRLRRVEIKRRFLALRCLWWSETVDVTIRAAPTTTGQSLHRKSSRRTRYRVGSHVLLLTSPAPITSRVRARCPIILQKGLPDLRAIIQCIKTQLHATITQLYLNDSQLSSTHSNATQTNSTNANNNGNEIILFRHEKSKK